MTDQPSRSTPKLTATFPGFSAGKVGTVVIPEPFFSELLPLIDDLAELKLTIYCFWALQQREGEYRYIRRRDLAADQVLLAGLDADADKAANTLSRGLKQCIARGTLLEVMLPAPLGETLYFMNTDKGRRAVEALERGDWVPGDQDRPVTLIGSKPNIFALYEQNIGPLTPILAETLRDAEKSYPQEWIAEAFKAAIENNKRNWRYIEAILKRWTNEGKSSAAPAKNEPNNTHRYLQDEYFQRRTRPEPDEG